MKQEKYLTKKILKIIKKNLEKVFKKFLSFESSNSALLIDNYDWLINLKYINFLREIGSKFSVNKMMSLESIKQRLNREQNLSFLEFNYSLLQAYDFLELNRKNNCKIQFGGSDQWGNIVSGIDLIRKITNEEVYGITTPLITTSSGKKMGKTEEGAIWLSEDKLDVNSFWQYWRNTSDDDVINFLYLFTELESDEIDKLKKLQGEELNEAKILLANEVTKLCHDEEKSKKAANEAKSILSSNIFDIKTLKESDNKITIKKEQISLGITLKQIMIDLKLCNSNGEAKRLIGQDAVKINKEIIKNKEFMINEKSFIKEASQKNQYIVVFVGKKKFGVVELVT